jgi:catechol 2,3-dioxygenase-like lactoylglutathione lyase family enzyme
MNLRSIEAKAFVPAKDFDVALRFYQDLGFSLVWSTGEVACFCHGSSAFLLQNFYVKEHIENFKMHLLVENVDDWWQHIQAECILERYSVKSEPPADRAWGMRDFVLFDPSGVMWRVGQPIAGAA